MISEQAVRRTLKQLNAIPQFPYGCVSKAFELLLKNEEAIAEEREQQHNEIIEEIGQY